MTIHNLSGPSHKVTVKYKGGLLSAFYYELEKDEFQFKEVASDVCSDPDNYGQSLKRVLEKLEEITGLEFIKKPDLEIQNEPNRDNPQ